MITVFITFRNDPSVGLFAENYKMEIPDPREGFTESDTHFKELMEEQRLAIKELYDELHGDSSCDVMFDCEFDEIAKDMIATDAFLDVYDEHGNKYEDLPGPDDLKEFENSDDANY